MPSSYSASGRFTLQAPGEGTNTWGTILNTGVFALVDSAIFGMVSFTLSGNKTLTTANGAADEARQAILNVTGGTGGTITIPSVTKPYLVNNQSTGNVVITTGAGRTTTIATGNRAFIICDATNVDRGPAQVDIDAALTAAKTYTDNKVVAGANLPGSSLPRAVVYTDPVSGNAIWKLLTTADISDAASRKFALAMAVAL